MRPGPSAIQLRGVRQNNLRDLDLEIPVGRWTVITGLSGTGKSSLAFETLHAEGQRRYVETFSAYTRQFLEMMGRPEVDTVDGIRPSIAIEQKNSVKTSRSTVGTMTELCDFFKAWFPTAARLVDPADGREIRRDSPETVWQAARGEAGKEAVLVAFPVRCPDNHEPREVIAPLLRQGYLRAVRGETVLRLEDGGADDLAPGETLWVLQDRVRPRPDQRNRFLEACTAAFRQGKGTLRLFRGDGGSLRSFSETLASPVTGRRFRDPVPSLFSYNSPLGACPACRGFGRQIRIDPELVVPDPSLSLAEGAVRPFQGKVYSNCLEDLHQHAPRLRIRMGVPWCELSEREQRLVWEGEADYDTEDDDAWRFQWYGIDRFFGWLERNVYKMHVRVFLSKYRSYDTCAECGGARFGGETLCWRWHGHTLADLYEMEIHELARLLAWESPPSPSGGLDPAPPATNGNGSSSHPGAEVLAEIQRRLRFLEQVGLGYLTLNRATRTLSGGETERVSLTTCLGTSMVETLFVLDEPSVGLHPRDIDQLIEVLRALTDQGNTVVVVEHDDRLIRAADHVLELGPEPGRRGGRLLFRGTPAQLARATGTATGPFLAGTATGAGPGEDLPARAAEDPLPFRANRRAALRGSLRIRGATRNNLRDLAIDLPLQQLVAISGVSGSGKSTLLHNVLFSAVRRHFGQPAEDPATVDSIEADLPFTGPVLVDQSGLSKTPRSNPAVFTGAWDDFRKALAATEEARAAGMDASHFSFNSGDGRCPHCEGLGYEQVEMQFLSDLFLPCPACEGRRFRPEVLAVELQGHPVDALLRMEVGEALRTFGSIPGVAPKLRPVDAVGLGYLPLGQPLNQLSGGEAQRLKLVRHLGRLRPRDHGSLLLLDEPTTGLHRADVARLLAVLRQLVALGHSVVVVEHHPDLLEAAEWLLELGPGAGAAGGRLIAAGTPAGIAAGSTPTAPYLFEPPIPPSDGNGTSPALRRNGRLPRPRAVRVEGATEHNLRDISVEIPHGQLTVVSGVSGSGKSTLAFDIVFAEGQRRFLESMSPYARQFVEQLPKPAVRSLGGLAPSVAIEQRVNRGTAKSTVATITEVAQYLRLLFARIGTQYNPRTGHPVRALSPEELRAAFAAAIAMVPPSQPRWLGAPLVRGRKGHYQPLAHWAADRGWPYLVCDGRWVRPEQFQKLDRYREHDLDLILGPLHRETPSNERDALLDEALRLGKGSVFLAEGESRRQLFSRSRVDPETGEGFPPLDPKHFSWNSPRGWCPTCRGRGSLEAEDGEGEPTCPDCGGTRLSERSRAVCLHAGEERYHLPDLLSLRPAALLGVLESLTGSDRDRRILNELLPALRERLAFLGRIGLDYLTLDRATRTLSGGEAQRIRLAAQLGSNLTGVLYVLDEPTIGLHARDNLRLVDSLRELKERGNTVLVVEHDEDLIRAADRVIDIGPGAGVHGGEVVATGTPRQLLRSRQSRTGQMLREPPRHPVRGARRPLPPRRGPGEPRWISLREVRFRNWQGDSVEFPRARLTAVCGVSGAGKSSLVREVLGRGVAAGLRGALDKLGKRELRATLGVPAGAPAPAARLSGYRGLRAVVRIDQAPIGKTSRSTPATYIGVFDRIREAFAQLPEARLRGLGASAFSFNTKGGRCEECRGTGQKKLEMSFLPQAAVACESCRGQRYREDLLEIRWKGRNIAEVLGMSFEEAADFFDFDTRIQHMLDLMVESGLGYLTLGQPSPTLSGGEAQRLKLVSELAASAGPGAVATRARNLYLIEEPTIGLHLSDCTRLTGILHRLVDQGHTVIVLEHHPAVLAEADHLLEIGPEGGEAGGRLLFAGTPEELAARRDSPTGPFLRRALGLGE